LCPRALSEACTFGTPPLSASTACSIAGIAINPPIKNTPKATTSASSRVFCVIKLAINDFDDDR